MAGVNPDDLADLIATTLDDLPDGQFEVMWDSQDYEFAKIYQKANRKIDSGKAITRNVMLDHTGRARYRRMYDTDDPEVKNSQHQITVPWTQLGTDYSWDVFELKQNTGARGFINLIESRRVAELWSMAELFEERGWKTPTNSSDNLYPFGVPYYLNMLDAGSTTGGFEGKTIRFQDGTTSTTCAGIDASDEDKWRNYADVYTNIDNAFLRKMRKAFRQTRFKPPANINAPGNDSLGAYRKVYAGEDQITELEDLADKRDDNNTPQDLMGGVKVDGTTSELRINRWPVCFTPHLDGADHSPIYAIDWSKLQPIVFDGHWMVESDPIVDRGQHSTITVFLDAAHQNLCVNRRTAGYVLHQAIPA